MQADEVDTETAKFLQRIHELAQASGESVVSVNHHSVDLALSAVSPEAIEVWPALKLTTHTIYILTSDTPAAPANVLSQLAELHLWILAVERANTSIKRDGLNYSKLLSVARSLCLTHLRSPKLSEHHQRSIWVAAPFRALGHQTFFARETTKPVAADFLTTSQRRLG
jgi:hypothetical protein